VRTAVASLVHQSILLTLNLNTMICCDTYIDLGCLNSCNDLEIGTNALLNGIYLLELDNNGTINTSSVTLLIGAAIIFNVKLNENMAYTGRVIDPNGGFICYKFKTYNSVAA